jgi:hypothetical protein
VKDVTHHVIVGCREVDFHRTLPVMLWIRGLTRIFLPCPALPPPAARPPDLQANLNLPVRCPGGAAINSCKRYLNLDKKQCTNWHVYIKAHCPILLSCTGPSVDPAGCGGCPTGAMQVRAGLGAPGVWQRYWGTIKEPCSQVVHRVQGGSLGVPCLLLHCFNGKLWFCSICAHQLVLTTTH